MCVIHTFRCERSNAGNGKRETREYVRETERKQEKQVEKIHGARSETERSWLSRKGSIVTLPLL